MKNSKTLVELDGKERVRITHVKRILLFSSDSLMIETSEGILSIEGEYMLIENFNNGVVNVNGIINSFSYEEDNNKY